MYKKYLKRLLKERGMKQIELCRLTGIPKSAMSQYLSGKHIPDENRRALIAGVLGETYDKEAEEERAGTLSVNDAAILLGKGRAFVTKGLQDGIFPWGYAVQSDSGRWSYYISRAKFHEHTGINV